MDAKSIPAPWCHSFMFISNLKLHRTRVIPGMNGYLHDLNQNHVLDAIRRHASKRDQPLANLRQDVTGEGTPFANLSNRCKMCQTRGVYQLRLRKVIFVIRHIFPET